MEFVNSRNVLNTELYSVMLEMLVAPRLWLLFDLGQDPYIRLQSVNVVFIGTYSISVPCLF